MFNGQQSGELAAAIFKIVSMLKMEASGLKLW